MRYPVLLAMLFVMLSTSSVRGSEATVFSYRVESPMMQVYQDLYVHIEKERFYVVFEPDIGRNLARFEERWGDDYNRNGLSGIRSMVFCNAWYANAVSNKDPSMLGLCPLHISLYEKDGETTVLFNRPTVIAHGSAALPVIEEIESVIIGAIRKLSGE